MKHNRKSSLFTGFLIGGIVGSVVAMLYTPVTGKKLRKKISATTDDVLDNVNEYIKSSKGKADEVIRSGRKRAEAILQEAKNLVS